MEKKVKCKYCGGDPITISENADEGKGYSSIEWYVKCKECGAHTKKLKQLDLDYGDKKVKLRIKKELNKLWDYGHIKPEYVSIPKYEYIQLMRLRHNAIYKQGMM